MNLPVTAGPTPKSVRVCPSQDGATNWFSASFDPRSGYYLVQTFESVVSSRRERPKNGKLDVVTGVDRNGSCRARFLTRS